MAGAGLTYRDWRERVPELLEAAVARWGLTLGEAYPPGAAGHVVRATLTDGAPAVLKLVFPHREAEHEADALAVWNGEGAVRLLAFVDETMEALLELSTSQDEQVLLHQDLHTVNVLAAERESWLVIESSQLHVHVETVQWLRAA